MSPRCALATIGCAGLTLLVLAGCQSRGWYTEADTLWWRVRGAAPPHHETGFRNQVLARTPAHQASENNETPALQPPAEQTKPKLTDVIPNAQPLDKPRPLSDQQSPDPKQPLDLDGLIALALETHPTLVAARWDVEAARGRMIQAGLYPNPEISYEAQNVGERGPAGNGGLHGFGIEQEFITGGKLRLAQQVAQYDLSATDWQLVARRYDVLTRIRLAWVEYAFAQEQVRILEQFVRLVGEEETGLVPLARRLEKVAGLRWELLRAEIELQNARAQLAAAKRQAEAARLALLATANLPPNTPIVPNPALPREVPTYRYDTTITTILQRSAELRQAELAVLRAQQEWQRVAVQNIPNFRVRALPLYSASEDNAQFQIEVRIPIPVFDRQQGNLLAAQAELARNARLVDSTRLELTRRLAEAYGRYAAAQQQAQTFFQDILPRASESLKVMRLAFQLAKAEELRSAFLGLLEAYRAWLEAQLGYLQVRRNLWSAVFEIAGLAQQDIVESIP
ncbi:MAG: TolC family protein [Gemmatales bacterium]|nr:TolC family protein [Gemmatales bacterium]MDW7993584.1 TolC family protein [Gemmatales bacterium]